MKKYLVLLILTLSSCFLPAQTTVTIGTGAGGTQSKPFGMWKGYERSASLYTFAEIGSYGFITTLGWEVGVGDLETCPAKIYLKQTSSTTLAAATWSTMTSGATLVYDGTTTFPAVGWRSIDIADFAYSASNLLVLCETNYGGNGGTSYPEFNYNYYLTTHESWGNNTTPPSGSGGVDNNRPNIQVTMFSPLATPVPPSGFMSTVISSSQVNLLWKRNAVPDNVMVAYNSINSFGVPSGSYVAGSAIAGGGTVIYNGSATSFSQTTGLGPATTYYYKAWSVHASAYSAGASSVAATLCDPTVNFPCLTDFESTAFPPACWLQASKTWSRSTAASGYGSGSASVKADFFSTPSGNFDLISPKLDFGMLSNAIVTFDHAYAADGIVVDRLELYGSLNDGVAYTLLTTWLGGAAGPLNTAGTAAVAFVPAAGQWATKSYQLPAGTNRVKFRGVSAYGNNLYLDNITFSGSCLPPATLSASNITASGADLSWTPVGTTTTWEIKWGETGFNPLTAGTLVSPVTSNPYSLGGLLPNHGYSYYIRSDCNSLLSSWAGPCNFTTICGIFPLPYLENFNSFTPPATGCLAVTDDNADGVKWVTSALYPHSSPNSMYIYRNATKVMNDWFFTPDMDLTQGITYMLSFYYRSSSSTANPEKLEVKWGLSPNAAGMTTGLLWSNATLQTATYLQAIVFFTPPSTDVYYIGWHGYSAKNMQFICVDDLTVGEVTQVTWSGGTSASWNNPVNWSPPIVPLAAMDVIIPGTPAPAFYPTLSTTGLTCKDLTINSGASLTISSGMAVTVNGTLTIKAGASLNNLGSISLKGNLDNQNPN
ncbi:MAG: choice-of-anchor J domain-containing protein [Bacteroidota bacterium]